MNPLNQKIKLALIVIAVSISGCVTYSTIHSRSVTITIAPETKLSVKGLPLP